MLVVLFVWKVEAVNTSKRRRNILHNSILWKRLATNVSDRIAVWTGKELGWSSATP